MTSSSTIPLRSNRLRPHPKVVRVPSDVDVPAPGEITLEAFRELLLELTGRRLTALAEITPQADPSPRRN